MVKFILTGLPRTGTTVISGSLILHPEALFYGELLNDTAEIRVSEAQRKTLGAGWQFEKPMGWDVEPCSYNESAHPFLNKFYGRENLPFKALGFKILYQQITQGPNHDAWSYIANDPDIRIIRTQRENLIEVICSYVRAHMTRRWHTNAENIPNKHRFIVPPEEFLNFFKRFEKVPEAFQHIEQSHQVLDLHYDRICEDFNACMADIYSFLGIGTGEIIPPRLKKIAGLKPNEELANYEELKKYFENTPYGKYFIY